jgi:hypothetical protein
MDTQPTEGTWYENDVGDHFVVVAVHPERGTIEIGTLNGSVDEMDLEEWSGMTLQEIEPPENGTARWTIFFRADAKNPSSRPADAGRRRPDRAPPEMAAMR